MEWKRDKLLKNTNKKGYKIANSTDQTEWCNRYFNLASLSKLFKGRKTYYVIDEIIIELGVICIMHIKPMPYAYVGTLSKNKMYIVKRFHWSIYFCIL